MQTLLNTNIRDILNKRFSDKKLIRNHESTKNSIFSFDGRNSRGQITLNNDVIVSGNEINPEKIYIKKKMLGSGAFGEVWLVRHKDFRTRIRYENYKKKKK